MPATVASRARRIDQRVAREVGEEIERLRLDAGLSRRAVAAAAGVDPAFLGRIEGGQARPSHETLARVAIVLGADLRTHLHPNTGPELRDRWQAQILEHLLGVLHPRWTVFTEVRVHQPSRGSIDALLHDPRDQVAIAAEIQSGLRRLEQLIRWSADKAGGLRSWDGWAHLGQEPRVSGLLLVRRTRATVETARTFEHQLRLAYPAHPDDAIAALTGTRPWPGPALVWASCDGRGARLVGRR